MDRKEQLILAVVTILVVALFAAATPTKIDVLVIDSGVDNSPEGSWIPSIPTTIVYEGDTATFNCTMRYWKGDSITVHLDTFEKGLGQ